MSRVVRWLLVLPAALGGFVAAQVVVILITLFVPWDLVSRLLSAFATPVGFVILGFRVAPSRKADVTGALVLMMVLLHVVIAAPFTGTETTGDIEHSAGVLLGVFGTLVGFSLVHPAGPSIPAMLLRRDQTSDGRPAELRGFRSRLRHSVKGYTLGAAQRHDGGWVRPSRAWWLLVLPLAAVWSASAIFSGVGGLVRMGIFVAALFITTEPDTIWTFDRFYFNPGAATVPWLLFPWLIFGVNVLVVRLTIDLPHWTSLGTLSRISLILTAAYSARLVEVFLMDVLAAVT